MVECRADSVPCPNPQALCLDGAGNILSEPMGELLSGLPRLSRLSLARCRLDAEVLRILSHCRSLEWLNLSRCAWREGEAVPPFISEEVGA
jgi:hypothetical protein